jgi:hypothetical protein
MWISAYPLVEKHFFPYDVHLSWIWNFVDTYLRPALYLKWEAMEKTTQGPWPVLEKPAFELDGLWM